ncbi:MAG: FG-GAP-like repeat-containing protein [Prevotellaceae bacterium]|jgi:RHS repeat-associated protein|nr:FG-GAP-like repeat-containing protein [Prevotellaceae bacterium]
MRQYLLICFYVVFPVFLTAQTTVVINELMYDTPLSESSGPDRYNGEFVSLYNYGDKAVDVSGWQLRSDGTEQNFIFPAGSIMRPRAKFYVAYRNMNGNFSLSDLYEEFRLGMYDRVFYQRSIVHANTGESIALYKPGGVLQDYMYYEGTSEKKKTPRLEAMNNDNTSGYQCVSLQRKNITVEDGAIVFVPTDYVSDTIKQSTNYDLFYSVKGEWLPASAFGSIAGAVDVSPTGAATYTMPIEMPAGVAGIQPSLSLLYNSQAGNGIMGTGFSFSGLSSITRTPRTIYSDGSSAGIKSSADDVFALDGTRLVAVAGSYGADGTEYRSETETFARIVSYGSYNGKGPDRFELTTKEGVVYRYGFSSGKQVCTGGAFTPEEKLLAVQGIYPNALVMAWHLDEVEYPNGQKISYEYETEGLCSYLKKISYGGNAVEFFYETRSDKLPVRFGRQRGSMDKILYKISSSTGDKLYRKYELRYVLDKFSRLAQLSLSNSAGETFNPTVFEWGAAAGTTMKAENVSVEAISSPSFAEQSFTTIDVNEDGLMDLMGFGQRNEARINYYGSQTYIATKNNDGSVIFNKQGEFARGANANLGQSVADFYGDGTNDILYVDSDSRLANSTDPHVWFRVDCMGGKRGCQNGWGEYGIALTKKHFAFVEIDEETPVYTTTDLNNDGKSELIYLRKITNSEGYIGGIVNFYEDRTPTEITFHVSLNKDPLKLTISDFDGNGMNDLCILTTDGYSIYYNNGGALSNIFSENNKTTGTDFNDKDFVRTMGDFNGDGLPDFVANVASKDWRLFLNTGNKSFQNIALTNFNTEEMEEESFTTKNDEHDFCLPMDFDGDGKTDLIVSNSDYDRESDISGSWGEFTGKHYIFWYRSTGDGFELVKKVTYDRDDVFQKHFALGDFNGDGMNELMFYGTNLWDESDTAKEWRLYSNANHSMQSDKITGIANGLNQKTKLRYTTLADGSVYARQGEAEYPVVEIQQPVPVIQNITTNPNTAAQQITNYNYKGAKVHAQGKGFLGFGEITASNNTSKRQIVSKYGYDSNYYFPYLSEQKVYSTTDAAITSIVNEYACAALGDKRFFPYLRKRTTTDELTGLTSVTENSNLDSYGNIQTTKTTKGSLQETTTVLYGTYGSWCPNKPLSISTTRTLNGDSQTRIKTFEYNNKGYLTKETTDLNDPNSVVVEYKDFDQFGQPRSMETASGNITRTRSVSYTASGRFVKSKTNELGDSTTYDWDETRGTLISQSDRLGTTTYEHDTWGRLNLTTYPNGTTSSQVLQWAISAPENLSNALYYSYSEISGQAPTTTWYNSLGQEVLNESFGLNNRKISVFTEYYPDGKQKRVSEPTFGSEAELWAVEYVYDSFGRVSSAKTPAGISSYNYSGLTTSIHSPSGTQENTLTDFGKTAQSKMNGKAVHHEYYPSGLVKTSTPEGGQPLAMEYDLQGNRTKLTDPDAGVISSEYNGFGELLWTRQKVHRTGDSITTTNTYLPNGLLDYTTRNGETTNYEYDNLHRLSYVEIAGQHRQTMTYDAFDRITNVKEEIDGKVYNTATAYDNLGRVLRETYPSGYYTENFYDNNGYLIKITDRQGRQIWEAVAENARGQILSEKRGNMTTYHTYNDKGFLINTNNNIFDWSYYYNSAGNLQQRSDANANMAEQFEYDNLNRLTNWTVYRGDDLLQSYSMSYHSGTGNITEKTDVGFSAMEYNADGKLHALSTHTFTETAPPNLSATYTDFKKLKTLAEGDKLYTLIYGVDDQRRKSEYHVDNVLKQTRYYLGNYEEEIDSNGNVRKIHYLSGGGIMVRNNGVDSLLFAYTDHLGSIVALSNYSGNLLENYAFDPWGRRRNPNNWTEADTRSAWIVNRGFTGHEHLDAFGIINMNGRVYDPLTAQFFSPDPFIQTPDSWLNYNRYTYGFNNPMSYIDPDGEIAWFVPVIIGAAIGMYSGGVIANDGNFNPVKWDYSSGKTWGYMLGGAVVGGVSAHLGASITAGGGFFANTGGIMASSFANSVGTFIYTGGQTPVTISFGIASYDFINNEWGYLGKKGNSVLENIGYGLGALANLADVNQFINSTKATLYTDNSDYISHSAIVDDKGNTLMSFGPDDAKVPDTDLGYAIFFRKSTSDYTVYKNLSVDISVNKYIFTATRGLGKILPFQGITTNCVNMASLSLWLNGIPNIGLHPYLLHATTWAYSVGIRPDLFSYYLTNTYKKQ